MRLSKNCLLLPCIPAILAAMVSLSLWAQPLEAAETWRVGTPIVTYWAGPAMSDRAARQMAEGGWNLVWCTERDLDLVHRHGLRAQLQDPLLSPASLENATQREKLDAMLRRVKNHPALYSYFIVDEPSAAAFGPLAKLVAYLRQQDPAHLAYINLFPTYATNQQLGTHGDTVQAYERYLDDFIAQVKPDLLSYDHYQFAVGGDTGQYFLNLALVRRSAQRANIPFLHIVQACTWTPSMRVPQPDEMRYLVYTTLAYGAQGISYYVYCHAGHTGGIALPDGTPTPLYHALKVLNRQFVSVARELQPLRSLGVYHMGMLPPGAESLPADSPFRIDPPVSPLDYKPPERVRGLLLGVFGPVDSQPRPQRATHALIVNLDYKAPAQPTLLGPAPLEVFDADSGTWSPAGNSRLTRPLLPGGGLLVRTNRPR